MALSRATLSDDADRVDLALASGIAVDTRFGLNTTTALILASKHNKINTLTRLLERGADPWLRDINGKHSFDYSNTESFNILIKKSELSNLQRNELFSKLCLTNRVSEAEELLTRYPGAAWPGALITSVMYSKSDIVRKLLENRCGDVTERNYKGQTPLMCAIERKLSVVRELIDAGSDINVVDIQNLQLSIYPIIYNDPNSMMLLLDRGVDPNDKSCTLFQHAIIVSNVFIALLLLIYGVDVDDDMCTIWIDYLDNSSKILELVSQWGSHYEDLGEDKCSICMEQEPDIRVKPCGHVFCRRCVFSVTEKCAQCRSVIETAYHRRDREIYTKSVSKA